MRISSAPTSNWTLFLRRGARVAHHEPELPVLGAALRRVWPSYREGGGRLAGAVRKGANWPVAAAGIGRSLSVAQTQSLVLPWAMAASPPFTLCSEGPRVVAWHWIAYVPHDASRSPVAVLDGRTRGPWAGPSGTWRLTLCRAGNIHWYVIVDIAGSPSFASPCLAFCAGWVGVERLLHALRPKLHDLSWVARRRLRRAASRAVQEMSVDVHSSIRSLPADMLAAMAPRD